MKKIGFIILIALFGSFRLTGQTTSIKGVVRDAVTGEAVSTASVTLLQQNISTLTGANGEFMLMYLEAGDDEVRISASGYFTQIRAVAIAANREADLGEIKLRPDMQADAKQDVILQLSEGQLDDEGSVQNVSGALSSSGDVYLSQTGYNFSPMRFRTRGYDNKYESTYINGVRFVDAERGGFNYSAIGGLNNATRMRDVIYGLSPNMFSYGNLGANTNIITRASSFATGSNANLALSNRAYKIRGQFTYGTGVLPNGWAFALSGSIRWADEGIVDGTFYNSAGLFLSAEKIIDNHSISLVAFGAPTRRAQQAAVTQEVFDLAGSIYYNPYWGYHEGEVRNSRIVESVDPTVVVSHVWKIDENQQLRTGLGFHYNNYSNTALGFYDAPDPRPDYYRKMPSYASSLQNESLADVIAEDWALNPALRQLDWAEMYRLNYENNIEKPGENARYNLERRHNNMIELALNSVYINQLSKVWKLTGGIEFRGSKGMHYKTMEDLLGGKRWIDIDQFAERDLASNENMTADVIQNNLNNPNRKIGVGDIFGYNYDMHVSTASLFALSEWNFARIDLYAGLQGTYTQFYRVGHMKNGRAPENSFGKGKQKGFTDPSLKAGLTYKIDGRSRIMLNVLAETRAPLVRDAYISDRIKDDFIPNLANEEILSYDLGYSFSYPFLQGRVSAFRTHINNTTKKVSYYDSEYATFMHHSLSGVDKLYQGIEFGASVPLSSSFTLSGAATFADYRYVKDAMGVLSWENGSEKDTAPHRVAIKNLKINSGPQLAANITLDYFHPKMWFADITLNYYDNNYLDFAPNRRVADNMSKFYTTPEIYDALGAQEKLKGGFMLDASIGKLIYLKNRQSLNFNLSLSNLLNNTEMITGGYQQARIPMAGGNLNTKGLNHFPNKYYYAWGFNFFFHVGYKF
ncbi:MAG: TonB-dependent receptor [Prevotellaceae bacterium]|jgi:hypothetical protein|nr:TonB-dependent receptor [Prevotellaceae bacterium]